MNQVNTFDRNTFMANFQGMEDLACETIKGFLETVPALMLAVATAIQLKNDSDLEIAAHTLKGAVSNFYAESSRLLAWRLEQMGHSKAMADSERIYIELKAELEKLSTELQSTLSERKAA